MVLKGKAGADAFDKARKAAFALPDVSEGTSWGVPALKVKNKMFACMAAHRSAEPNTLVARISFVDRDWLLSQDSHTYYLKPHYVDYPCILVRLDRVKSKDLRELLVNSRDFVASLRKPRKRRA